MAFYLSECGMCSGDESDGNNYFRWCLEAHKECKYMRVANTAYKVAKRKHLLNAELKWNLLESIADESSCWCHMFSYQAWCVKDVNDFEENYECGGSNFYMVWCYSNGFDYNHDDPGSPPKKIEKKKWFRYNGRLYRNMSEIV